MIDFLAVRRTVALVALIAAGTAHAQLMRYEAKSVSKHASVKSAMAQRVAPSLVPLAERDQLIAVRPDASEWAKLQVGERIAVPMPDGLTQHYTIESATVGYKGVLSFFGRAFESGSEQHFSFVVDPKNPASAYGQFTTAIGDFALMPQFSPAVGHQFNASNHAWMVKIEDLQAILPIMDRQRFLADGVPPPNIEEIIAEGRSQSGLRAKADPVCADTPTKPTTQTTVDILLIYTGDWVASHGASNVNARLAFLINGANATYNASNVAITLRLVGTQQVTYRTPTLDVNGFPDTSTALDDVSKGNGVFSGVRALRNQVGADLVGLLRGPFSDRSIAGIAFVGGFAQQDFSRFGEQMYSVSGDSPLFTNANLFTHEVGHNMGNAHDRGNENPGSLPGATTYSFGHVVCGTGANAACPNGAGFYSTGTGFGTIMAYPSPTVAKFSSPHLSCNNGRSNGITAPCGVAAGLTGAADNVRSMNCTREKLAAFRAAVTPACTAGDSDNDGIPNCVESTVSRNPSAKDNDVFNSPLLFVMQQYRDFLAREADAAGRGFWEGEIVAGRQTRASMIETFTTSGEFDQLTAPIARLYFGTYLRIPDFGGLAFWTDEFRSGRRALNDIGAAFAAAPEFVARYGANVDNRTFVNLLYQNILGRAADQAGSDFYTNQLNSGLARGSLLVEFTESTEYRQRRRGEIVTTLLYAGMLRREPNAIEFSASVGAINGGATAQSRITPILSSAEYRARFL